MTPVVPPVEQTYGPSKEERVGYFNYQIISPFQVGVLHLEIGSIICVTP